MRHVCLLALASALSGCSLIADLAKKLAEKSTAKVITDDVTVTEGQTQIQLPLDQTLAGNTLTVNFELLDPSGSVVQTSQIIVQEGASSVLVDPLSLPADNALDEDDRQYRMLISDSFGRAGALSVNVLDNDSPPSVNIADHAVNEGGALEFVVSLSAASGKPIEIDWTSANGGATSADSDFVAASGTLAFPAGAVTQTISLNTAADAKYEGDETLSIDLSNPLNATLADAHAVGTLTNDDAAPTVTFAGATSSTPENGGVYSITITQSAVSGLTTTIPFTIGAASTATGGGTDYSLSPSSPVTIAPGATAAVINMTVADDATYEGDETVVFAFGTLTNAANGAVVSETVTIQENDAPPVSLVVSTTKLTPNTSFSYVDLDADWGRNLAYAASRKSNTCIDAVDFSTPASPAIVKTIGSAALQVCLGVKLFDSNTKLVASSNNSSKIAAWNLTANPFTYASWSSIAELAYGHNGKRVSRVDSAGAGLWNIYAASRYNGKKMSLNVSTAALTQSAAYAPGGLEFNSGVVLGNRYLIQGVIGNTEPVRVLDLNMTLVSTDNMPFWNWTSVANAGDTSAFLGGGGTGTNGVAFYSNVAGTVSLARVYLVPTTCVVRAATYAAQGAAEYLYMICSNGTIEVFNVTDPTDPVRAFTGSIAGSHEGDAYGIAVKPNSATALVVSNRGDFLVLNLNGLTATSTQFATYP